MRLMISKLVAKEGEIGKSEKNISFEEWKATVEKNREIYFEFEKYGKVANGPRSYFSAIRMSKVDPYLGVWMFYNDFWFIVRVTFPDKLEHEFIPIVADFAEAMGAQLLIDDTRPYPREKIAYYKEKLQREGLQPKVRYRDESFGEGSAWLAVQGIGTYGVCEKLGLERTGAMPWVESLAASYGDQIVVTPPLNGWVLVHGDNLPRHISKLFGEVDTAAEPFSSLTRVVELMSEGGGNAQFYMSNEKSSVYAGFVADSGKLDFGFLHMETIHFNVGNIEKATAVSEDLSPLMVAAAFSIDPTDLVYFKGLEDLSFIMTKGL